MNRSKRNLLFTGIAALAAMTFATGVSAQAWKPTKPITIIVPWAAGGSTDQVTRVTAAEVEKALGQKVVIVNQPGASGSIGTKNALEAAKDGYTWTAGAAQDLGTYAVLGMLDTKIGDWALFLNVANVSTLSVNPSTPYKTPAELIDAMKAKPVRSAWPRQASTPAVTARWKRSPRPPASSTSTSPTTAAIRPSWRPSPVRPTSPRS
jgi:tripartite-type tricarboxylate transporter receptor subunit TctC